MKKIVAILLVLALVCGVAVAQDDSAAKGKGITLSGWGRGTFVPIKVTIPESGDTELTTGLGPPWGNKGAYIGVDINGSTDTVGFKVGLNNGGGVSMGTASVWAKPFDFLRLEYGKFEEYSLWGKVGGSDVWADLLVGMDGEANIFTQFAASDGGVLVSLTPIDGLYIGGLITTTDGADYGPGDKIEDVYEKLQIGAGYEIPNIGHFRAQFIGAKDEYTPVLTGIGDTEAKRAEVAFAFTGLSGLTLDVGVKINFPVEIELLGVKSTAQKGFVAAVGANYTSGDLGVKGRVDATFGKSVKATTGSTTTYEATEGVGLRVNVIPSYNLGFATVGGDIGVQLVPGTETKAGVTTTTDGDVAFGIGAWIQKGLGSGHIKTGLTLKPGKTTSFAIPVLLEYYF